MLLDEMNLARVEHYFSDWLACAESRRNPAGWLDHANIQCRCIARIRAMDTTLTKPDGGTETAGGSGCARAADQSRRYRHSECRRDHLRLQPKGARPRHGAWSSTRSISSACAAAATSEHRERLSVPRLCCRPSGWRRRRDYAALPAAAHGHLVAMNGILEEARLHLGYRAANEIALFMAIYNQILPDDPGDTEWARALDAAVLQKVLPRLSGNRAKLKPRSRHFASICATLRRHRSDAHLLEFDQAATAALPKSYRRAVEMLDSLRDFGFVSFFK